MEEFLRSPDGAAAIAMIGTFICITVIAVGCTVAVQWRKAREAGLEADLKREMIQHGMSADEIVKVLGASAASPDKSHG
jgi:hypothetical protein